MTLLAAIRGEGLGVDAGAKCVAGTGQNDTNSRRRVGNAREGRLQFLNHREVECVYRRARQTDNSDTGMLFNRNHTFLVPQLCFITPPYYAAASAADTPAIARSAPKAPPPPASARSPRPSSPMLPPALPTR